ncbi:MAG: serine hydrolase [Calditrichaeota bacterium]|nr:MAG: serine hydrolase [Calditrichota bacterium]MBL1205583.1 serine hydrolase [Calditrichota bacterium]NOG45412.1 serine hydrolase [Calditrichota bacterium]
MFIILLSFISFTGIINMEKNTLKLEEEIKSKLAKHNGNFAVAFRTIEENPISLFLNENEIFHAASTMKTPVMIEVFKQAESGKFNLTDSLEIKNEFKSIVDGSGFSLEISRDGGEGLYDFIGKKKTISDLVYDMIIRSSNLATNIVIEFLDAKKVTQTMREMGANTIQVLRGVEDMKAYNAGLSNTTTAKDLLAIYEKIASGRAVSKSASKKMTDILLDQKYNSIIPALLPKSIKVAHKTGSISGVRHDSGIVILEDGNKYVLVLLSKNLEDPDGAVKTMAEVSKMIYEFVKHNN